MSDLIIRKKVIDILEKEKSLRCSYDVDIAIFYIEKRIRELPATYSVDKVVDELEQKKEEVQRMRNTCVALSDLEVCDIENVIYERAIEIVKQDGVSDDVCEWEKGSSGYVGYPAYYSKCCQTNSKGLEMQTHIIADWKYCPYCGKNIKVVE